VKPGDHICRNS